MDTHSLTIIAAATAALGGLWWLKRPDISPSRACQLVADGALLVDVRSSAEFSRTHLDNARNIPVGELSRRATELGDKHQPIIVYCASGARSAAAKRMLKGAGFTEVYNLGSVGNW